MELIISKVSITINKPASNVVSVTYKSTYETILAENGENKAFHLKG